MSSSQQVAQRSERGISLVESALVAFFILMPLLIGTIDFGRAYFLNIEVANAARAAVQYGVQNTVTMTDKGDIQLAAMNEAPDIASSCSGSEPCWFPGYPLAEWGCECATASTAKGGTLNSTTCACGTDANGNAIHAVQFVRVTCRAQYTPLFTYGGLLPSTLTLSSQVKMRLATQ